MTSLGEILKTLRQAAGLSQQELARLAGIKPQQVSHMETGIRGIGPKSRMRLAKAFRLPLGEFDQILAGPHKKATVPLWLKIHSLPSKDVRKILSLLSKILEVRELDRKGQAPSGLYDSLLLKIETIVAEARKTANPLT
jgi:transcriptional regulator with XRE-family HTH domain